MSSNKLIYDEQYIKDFYKHNKSQIDYSLFDQKFYHEDKCRMEYNDQGVLPSPSEVINAPDTFIKIC